MLFTNKPRFCLNLWENYRLVFFDSLILLTSSVNFATSILASSLIVPISVSSFFSSLKYLSYNLLILLTDANIEVAKLTDEVLSNIGDNQENMNVSTHENDIHISKIGDNQKNINFNGNKVDYEINKIEDKLLLLFVGEN